ncbi:MAG: efflux transporter outer membrane subunit, partial [Sinobacteraceae bacterium]|nr:efflux transporter outer membrane subunit [Nevskiaceae bacterium]
MPKATIVLTAAALVCAGCTVGPDFHTPAPPTQQHYLAGKALNKTGNAPGAETGATQKFVRGAVLQRDWYQLYHNAALDKLIHQALADNPTRAAAEQRLKAAREAVNIVYGGRYPSLGINASATRERASGVILGVQDPNFANTFNLYTAQISTSYNLDIFGELTRRIENKQALAAMARDKLLDSEATLVNNIVATALAEAGARTTRDALGDIIDQQRKTLKLVKAQKRYGTALKSDVLRAQTQLAETQALIPDYDQQIAVARHRLAILSGRMPADYNGPQFTLNDFSLPTTLPLSLPSRLVGQRPDVLAARSMLHAASANVGVATAEMLPRIQLTASYGRDALKLNAFNGPLAELFTIGAGLTAP